MKILISGYHFVRKILPRHAGAILTYATRHSYPDILDIAGPLMIKEPLSDIMALLCPNQMVPWVMRHNTFSGSNTQCLPQAKYYEQWNQVWKDANSQALDCHTTSCTRPRPRRCGGLPEINFPGHLRGGIASLTDLGAVVLGVGNCCDSRREITSWRKLVERDIANIGSLRNFL
jgi:hypothetical protein